MFKLITITVFNLTLMLGVLMLPSSHTNAEGFGLPQVEKLPLWQQQFMKDIPRQPGSFTRDLQGPHGVFASNAGGAFHQWLYNIVAQCAGIEKGDDGTVPVCDFSKAPHEQSGLAMYRMALADLHEASVYGTVIMATRLSAEWNARTGETTRFTDPPTPDDPFPLLPRRLNHVFALMCERPYDHIFRIYDMKQQLADMATGLKPHYRAQIINHIETALAYDTNGDPVLLPDGTHQKIHPMGVHPDCKI